MQRDDGFAAMYQIERAVAPADGWERRIDHKQKLKKQVLNGWESPRASDMYQWLAEAGVV
jgi:hypothetical protein